MEKKKTYSAEMCSIFYLAIDSNNKKPQILTMQQLTNTLNNKMDTLPEFINLLKENIVKEKSPISQYLLLDLIEYTTCQCSANLYEEYNRKSFLKVINSLLMQENLHINVENKILHLIRFWELFFEENKYLYGNFTWFAAKLRSKGLSLSDNVISPYVALKPDMTTISSKEQASQVIELEFNKNQIKLLKDLNVVIDNLKLANSMIDQFELKALSDVLVYIKAAGMKLEDLQLKLKKIEEEILLKYVEAILDDIKFTKLRYKKLKLGKPVPNFNTKTQTIIEDFRDSPISLLYTNTTEISDKIFHSNNKNIGKEDSTERHAKQFQRVSFERISNYFYTDNISQNINSSNDNILRVGYTNTTGSGNNFIGESNEQMSIIVKEGDLLDLSKTIDGCSEIQNGIRFGIMNDSNYIDLDFTRRIEKTHNNAVGSGHKNIYSPKDELKFEKPENKLKEEKNHYDPFADIDAFDILNIK